MTNEQTLDLIRSYIDDIKKFREEENISLNKKQHLEKALSVYGELYKDAERGKVDLDFLHENISSYLYILQ